MKIFYLILFILTIPFAYAEIQFSKPEKATVEDYRKLSYPVYDHPLKLKNWKAISGDNPIYADPATNIDNWKKVRVGEAVTAQGIGGSWCWYRVNFNLPESWYGHPLLLDIGRISAYGVIYLNGIKCAASGTPPPHLKHGCSSVYWQFLLNPKLLNKGLNIMAIRVFIGCQNGLYEGAYTLQPLPQKTVCIKFPLKTKGEYSLKTLLTQAEHLNKVAPGSNIMLAPTLICTNNYINNGKLIIQIKDSKGHLLKQETADLKLRPGLWQKAIVKLRAPNTSGKYICTVRYNAGNSLLINKSLKFTVAPTSKLKFSIPVDSTITENGSLPVKVTPGPVGRFGPRLGSPKYQLRDNTERTDARSGMAYSVQISRSTGGPRLFLGNVRPVPENTRRTGRFHHAAGHEYDGVKDAWIYGYVRPNRAGIPQKLKVKNISWSGRSYHYTYPQNKYMNFRISAINPAWMAETNCQKLRVFDSINFFGIGLPKYLVYESNGKVKIVRANDGINGKDMSANWILTWFNGAKNWNEFDSPYLLVLEKRPKTVKTFGNAALFISSHKSVGKVQGMPLYGVSLLPPLQTAKWRSGIPQNVITRCRLWSRILASPPLKIHRTASVNYAKDRLTVQDKVSYSNWQDSWATQGIRIVPVNTILPLAVSSGNLKIAVNHPVTDLHMPTLQGPLVAAENTDTLTIAFNELLHYIREVREVKRDKTAEIKTIQNSFNKLLAKGYQTDLKQYPWKKMFSFGKFLPGGFRCQYTNLLLSRQWMNPDLRCKIDRNIKEVSEKYLLYTDLPDTAMQKHIKLKYRNEPVVTTLKNPATGLKLATATILKESFGIDSVYFSNLNIYMAWLYADTYNRYNWLKKHYDLLKKYFNAARNSHDWGTLASWDTFSGIRVGNGLQESGGIYAGALAMARIAYKLKDFQTSDLAAYHAIMQLVSMQGTLSATKYLNQYRPYPATHSKAAEIEYTRKIRPAYFAELNELAGLSHSLIGINNSASSPGGYLESPLPEVMRPYQEIWGKYTNDFYNPHYDTIIKTDRRLDNRISIDAFIYQTRRSPAELKKIFDMRSKLKHDWWKKLPDYRGYLDSMSEIKYRKLW
jgi:hypothetical protein